MEYATCTSKSVSTSSPKQVNSNNTLRRQRSAKGCVPNKWRVKKGLELDGQSTQNLKTLRNFCYKLQSYISFCFWLCANQPSSIVLKLYEGFVWECETYTIRRRNKWLFLLVQFTIYTKSARLVTLINTPWRRLFQFCTHIEQLITWSMCDSVCVHVPV